MEGRCHWGHQCGCHRGGIDAQCTLFAFAGDTMPNLFHRRLAGLRQLRLVDSTLDRLVISWRDNVQRSSFRRNGHSFCHNRAAFATTGYTCGRSAAKTKNIFDCNDPFVAIRSTLLSALPNSCKAKIIQLSPK